MNWDYAAGFIDADGSLGFFKEYGSKRLCLSAAQMSREVLDQLQELVGHGQIYERPSGRKGTMNTDKVLYVWRTTGYKMLPALVELQPRLIVKKGICTEMIEYAVAKGFWDPERQGV